MKKSEIKISVTLDDDKVPSRLEWEAGDSGMEGSRVCNATLLTMWDPAEHTTLRIDLWTKEMTIEDMKRFFYENFFTLADTYQRATNDLELTAEIKKFAESFGKKAGVTGRPKS